MKYERHILQRLTEVGQRGISVRALAKNVYNLNCTLFSTPDMNEIHSNVQKYLLRNSKSPSSIIQRTGRRGFYRLNTQNSADAQQLMLMFCKHDDEDEEKEEKPRQDFSLSLFD